MVLRIVLVIALAGCGQSLFDSHGSVDGGGSGSGDSSVPATCPSPCLADAAGDFDGTPRGSTGLWRYLDDLRPTRAWTPMAGDANGVTGAGSNAISTCAKQGSAAACAQLPGAMLVSSTGASSTADPAIELTNDTNRNLQLTLRVHVPTGGTEQLVRLYRNSREDTLITVLALPGATVDQLVKVDALAGDRFLLSLAPTGMGATDVAVQLFASSTGAVFPVDCRSAYTFETGTVKPTAVNDQCRSNGLTSSDYTTASADPVVRGAGPFPELGEAIRLVNNKYYEATTVTERPGDSTLQMWVKIDTMPAQGTGAWVFADEDLDLGGGLGLVIFDDTGTSPMLQFGTCTQGSPPGPLMFAESAVSYPNPLEWHFLRIVHKGGTVSACIDGVKKGSYALPSGKMASSIFPELGRNKFGQPGGAYTVGRIDDVRLYNTALTCE